MILAIDIGNTNIVLGCMEHDRILVEARMATDLLKTSDQYCVELKNLLNLYEVDLQAIEGVIISSVVPPVLNSCRTAVRKLTGKTPMIVGPGPKISAEALSARTAQLPAISLESPKKAIGKNTIDAMRSGVMLGSACMVDGMIDRIDAELGGGATVVATGGIARFVLPMCRHAIEYDRDLLLKGLALLYENNCREK